jgi:large subunit ribosomal protein L3
MPIGLVGRKCGMTRVFTEDGVSIPVTVLAVLPNRVVQIKTNEVDGYCAFQVTNGERAASRVNKSQAGHYAKANMEAGLGLCEFRVNEADLADVSLGHTFTVEMFEAGQKVDISGITKGKGFAGGIKRHNFGAQRNSHGNSVSHRAPGSIGQNQTPGRVFKGKKMSGHMGNVKRTAQNQEIVKIDAERHLILIKGAVPGAPGGKVMLTPSVKEKGDK